MSGPGRNDPCPCGSGKKYKHCCYEADAANARRADQSLRAAQQEFEAGRLSRAEAGCREALQQAPDHAGARRLLDRLAEAYGRLGIDHLRRGETDAGMACLQQALALRPDSAEAHYNLGTACSNQGRLDEAVAAFRQALALKPDFFAALVNLANALSQQGRLDEAVACFRQALALKPDYALAHYNLGRAFLGQGRLEQAEASLRRALALNPDDAESHLNLGTVHVQQERLDEADACFRRALALRPDLAEACYNLGTVLHKLGRPGEAVDWLQRALALKPEAVAAHSNWLLALHSMAGVTPAEAFAAHRGFAERFEAPLVSRWPAHANSRDPLRRLKVGYVSPDFRNHSVAFFMEPLLARHDPAEVEVYCYYNNAVRDAVTERLAAYPVRWVPCHELTDDQLAARIRAEGIDILVDLAGHTRDNRLLVFARKPAPVQVSYLGYPATTGLSAVDYRLCTADTDPPGQEAWHSETLYRLPGSLWCYRPPADLAQAALPPPCERNGWVTFGSLNNFTKISPEAVALWAEILRAVPDSRLAMTCVPEGSARKDLRARFAAHGVADDRLDLHGRLPREQFRAFPDVIDIGLDAFPYNGTTTTCETLWMGAPVVALEGQSSVARSGYALLKAVGLSDLCARDEAGYLRIAVDLARDPARLGELRRGMRARLETSPLRDEAGFTRAVEAAFRAMWRAWCERPAA